MPSCSPELPPPPPLQSPLFSFSLTLLVLSLPGAPQIQHLLPSWSDLASSHASCQRPLALCRLPSCTPFSRPPLRLLAPHFRQLLDFTY